MWWRLTAGLKRLFKFQLLQGISHTGENPFITEVTTSGDSFIVGVDA